MINPKETEIKRCCKKCRRFWCIQMRLGPNKTGYECENKRCACHSFSDPIEVADSIRKELTQILEEEKMKIMDIIDKLLEKKG